MLSIVQSPAEMKASELLSRILSTINFIFLIKVFSQSKNKIKNYCRTKETQAVTKSCLTEGEKLSVHKTADNRLIYKIY